MELNFDIENTEPENDAPSASYTEDDITTLDWRQHIRLRPGMYIGKLGDGTSADDGIYVLLKEVLDNSIDEFMMGFGKKIEVRVDTVSAGGSVSVTDYGRGIALGKVVDVASKINTGGKYDSKAFQKSVGLNGVGIKAVNALSTSFTVESCRDGQCKRVVFHRGELVEDSSVEPTERPNGTSVTFTPDSEIFRDFAYREEYVVQLLKNYTFLNTGLKGDDIEVAITHANQYGEEFYSFVNGQHTTQGGTHLSAFKEAVTRTVKDFYNRSFEPSDIRNGMVAAVAIRVQEPVFESQTKTRLGSREMGPDGPTVAKFVGDFLKKELDNYLHRDRDTAEIVLRKIQESERDRKAIAVVAKKSRETAKKVSLYNRKLNDCRVHLSDSRGNEEKKLASSIFITEGDSAGGTIEKVRDVETQAVFKLRGKPLNTYGASKRELYANEEFSLLQAALNIEESIDNLRYNKVIIATDADVDGMHIRLLMLTFFLQYFPDLVKKGHVYVLQTPLFRVRNGRTARNTRSARQTPPDTVYCYSDTERLEAIHRFGADAEITRFKGLGEISPDEFRHFIGPDMRADRVSLRKDDGMAEVLEFYMGKNTPERQNFIIENLVIEDDTDIDRD